MFGRTEQPDPGGFGDIHGASQIRRLAKRNILQAASRHVVNRRCEGCRAVAGHHDSFDPEKRGGSKYRSDVMRVLQAIECQPQSGIGIGVSKDLLNQQAISFANGRLCRAGSLELLVGVLPCFGEIRTYRNLMLFGQRDDLLPGGRGLPRR